MDIWFIVLLDNDTRIRITNRKDHRFWLFCKWQIADPAEIERMVEKVLTENPKQLEQYRGGKTKLQGFFAGQVKANPSRNLIYHDHKSALARSCSSSLTYLNNNLLFQVMKASKGKANPGLLNKILLEKLNAKS